MPTNRDPRFENPLSASELRARAGRDRRQQRKPPKRARKIAAALMERARTDRGAQILVDELLVQHAAQTKRS